MNKILYALATVLGFASCANTYNIEGTINPATLDGQKVYLQVFSEDADNYLTNIDSCEVMHGKFSFTGVVDSTQWANIYMAVKSPAPVPIVLENGNVVMDFTDNFPVPVVLENGNIVVRVDNTQRTISGTPQNEELNTFYRNIIQFWSQLNEANRSEAQLLLDGMPEMEAYKQAYLKQRQVLNSADKQFTSFISSNFDNAAGSCAFWMLCATGFNDPVWAEALLSNASSTFKNDGFVKLYCSETKKMQDLRNGTADMPSVAEQAPTVGSEPPMTPNEMAGDSTAQNDGE